MASIYAQTTEAPIDVSRWSADTNELLACSLRVCGPSSSSRFLATARQHLESGPNALVLTLGEFPAHAAFEAHLALGQRESASRHLACMSEVAVVLMGQRNDRAYASVRRSGMKIAFEHHGWDEGTALAGAVIRMCHYLGTGRSVSGRTPHSGLIN